MMVIDESHQSIPQILACLEATVGKRTLVNMGSLASALDNRPLTLRNLKPHCQPFTFSTPGHMSDKNRR